MHQSLSFKNIFLSNIKVDTKSYLYRKILMSNILLYIAMVIFPLFTLIHISVNHNLLIIGVDLTLFIFSCFTWYDLRKNKTIERTTTLILILVILGVLGAIVASKGANFVALWSMTVPFIVFILKGYRQGVYYLIAFYLALFPLLYLYTIESTNFIQMVRFVLITLVILFIAYFFERTVSTTFKLLQRSHHEIASSIQYANNIQKSFLTPPDQITTSFPNHLLIWLPKDIVSGDLYIYQEYPDGLLIGVADCTGHGVPGGFMTILAGSNIRRIARGIFYNPAKILQKLNCAIKDQLRQDEDNRLSNDGLDIALCFIPKKRSYAIYAGAQIDLVTIDPHNKHLQTIKADKQSLGYKKSKRDYLYTNHKIELSHGKRLYLYSDGYIDQVGGKKGFIYGNKKLKQLLLSIQDHPMHIQKEKLLAELNRYQGEQERRDDITIFGIQIDAQDSASHAII
jgi:serine phosphatase RsbU (regulator of sigma subunit)